MIGRGGAGADEVGKHQVVRVLGCVAARPAGEEGRLAAAGLARDDGRTAIRAPYVFAEAPGLVLAPNVKARALLGEGIVRLPLKSEWVRLGGVGRILGADRLP